MIRRRRFAAALTLCLSTTLTACSAQSVSSTLPTNPSPGGSVPADPGTAMPIDPHYTDRLPAHVRETGAVVIAAGDSARPLSFNSADARVPQGLDVDLLKSVFDRLGVSIEWKVTTGSAAMSSVGAGEADVATGGFVITDRVKRRSAAVSYLKSGAILAVRADKAKNFKPDALCGRTISVLKNSSAHKQTLPRLNARCGKKPIVVITAANQDAAVKAVTTAKADAYLGSAVAVGYAVRNSSGTLDVVSEVINAVPYGFAVSSDQMAFANVIADVLTEMRRDGEYQAILKRYGLERCELNAFDVLTT